MTSSAQGTGPVPMRRPCSRCGERLRRQSFSAVAWREKGDHERVCRTCRSYDSHATGPKVPTMTEHELDLIRQTLRCSSCHEYPRPQEDSRIWTMHLPTCATIWQPP